MTLTLVTQMPRQKRWIERRKRTVEAWVAEVKCMLSLSDWEIKFNWEGNEFTHPLHGEELQAFASITPIPSSKHAELSISRELLDLSPEEQTQTLVHELVHCHLFALHEYAQASFATAAGRNKLANDLHRNGLVQHIECATDALADAFYKLSPQIDLT